LLPAPAAATLFGGIRFNWFEITIEKGDHSVVLAVAVGVCQIARVVAREGRPPGADDRIAIISREFVDAVAPLPVLRARINPAGEQSGADRQRQA
jgi:hypothetical protein